MNAIGHFLGRYRAAMAARIWAPRRRLSTGRHIRPEDHAPLSRVAERGHAGAVRGPGPWRSARGTSCPPESVMILASLRSQSHRLLSTRSRWAASRGRPIRPRLKVTVAHTVSKASVVSSWGTRPILRRAARKSRTTSCPSAVTRPEVGLTGPQTMPISVVLRAPFGPKSANISPRRISRETFLRPPGLPGMSCTDFQSRGWRTRLLRVRAT